MLHVRTAAGPDALVAPIRHEILAIDGEALISEVRTVPQVIHSQVRQDRMIATLATFFALLALALSAIGIYGIVAYGVAHRIPEIGIRMALGATRKEIMLLVFRQGGVSTLVGLGCGLAAGLGLAHLLRSMIVNVSPVDPISIGVTIMVLALTSVLAGWLPARRAAKIDPMAALRYE